MIEQIKYYLIQVGLKKYAPVAAMSAMAALGTLMAAHAGMLEQWGVNYIAQWTPDWLTTHTVSGPVLLIELDTTSTAMIAAIVALITLMSRASEHHTIGTASREVGGRRPDDPPAPPTPSPTI